MASVQTLLAARSVATGGGQKRGEEMEEDGSLSLELPDENSRRDGIHVRKKTISSELQVKLSILQQISTFCLVGFKAEDLKTKFPSLKSETGLTS